ncbi:MAG: hypothetical protein LBU25_08160 [Treponema sp.]|nr:hypothetical protein [Treponema sp.]
MGTRYGGIDLAKRSILEGCIPDGLIAPRSRAYACLDPGWELPARMLEAAAGCRVLPLNPGDLRIILQPRTAAINRLYGLYPRMGILMET